MGGAEGAKRSQQRNYVGDSMDILRKAAQAVLDAYEQHDPLGVVMADLRAALAQPDESFCDTHCTWHNHHPDCAFAQPERKPLTDAEVYALVDATLEHGRCALARAIERAHGIE
jgi:hypothetical protein